MFLYLHDEFQRPNPFRPDVVVDIGGVIEKKIDGLLRMDSQFVEGGCCSEAPIPDTPEEIETAERQARERFRDRYRRRAGEARERLVELYGEQRGENVEYAEIFQLCEYGSQPSPEELAKLFPFEGLNYKPIEGADRRTNRRD